MFDDNEVIIKDWNKIRFSSDIFIPNDVSINEVQAYLEECKYKLKKRKLVCFIDSEIIDDDSDVKNMTDEQKQKYKDYRREYYKKYYAAKKLNNNKIIDDNDNDNKIIDDSDNDNKIINDNDNDFYYISIILKFLNAF